ncbi:tripartite tricarboxylate transporter substrate-binding protein, partial [Nonomuraea sp. NPDC050405]
APGRGVRGRFAIVPGGERWTRVAQALGTAAWDAGFAVSREGEATRITVTGLTALAAAALNDGPTLLDTATPLARLAGEVEVVVVPAASKFRDFDDFGAHLLARPGETMLAGGPRGEPDHLLFGLVARGLGADTRQVVYTGYPSSEDVAEALLGGKAAAAAGTLADWRHDLRTGRVKALAVSCAHRVDGIDAPSLLESGVRVDFAAWCAAVGPHGMSGDTRDAALEMCEAVSRSAPWREVCRRRGWSALPLLGDDFALWLGTEIGRTRGVLRDLGLVNTNGTTCGASCANGH